MTSRIVVALIASACASCATHRALPDAAWAPATAKDLDDNRIDDDGAAAVVLLRERRFLFEGDHSQFESHEVTKLLSEAAFDKAAVKLLWPRDSRLVSFEAHIISADGVVSTIAPGDLFTSEIKTGGDEENKQLEMRAFRFPHVEVGSIIDIRFRLDMDHTWSHWSENIADALPIRDYKVDVAIPDTDAPAMRVVNADVTPSFTNVDGLRHASFEMWDVPAHVDERFAPASSTREPWWIYRDASWIPGWKAASWDFVPILRGKGLDGAPAIDTSSCAGDFRCIVAIALQKTREVTRFSGFSPAFRFRTVGEMLATKAANASEKAVLLYAILKKAGVDARIAGVATVGAHPVEDDFPATAWLNHTLVVAVSGDQASWLDPSCEFCRPGYLPAWDPVGAYALVVSGKREPEATWWKVNGPRETEPGDGNKITTTIHLRENGDAHVVVDETRTGKDALMWSALTRNDDDDDARERAEMSMGKIFRVTAAGHVTCDRARGVCTRHSEADVAHYAAQVRDGLAVPLDALGVGFFVDDVDRKTDVELDNAWSGVDEVTIEPPAGMHVVSAPPPASGKGALADVVVSVDGAHVSRTVKLSAGTVKRGEIGSLARALDVGAGAASAVVTLAPANH